MKQQQDGKRFLTAGRAALAFAAFAATALYASSCVSNDTASLANQQAANAARQQPKVTITSSKGNQQQSPQQPPPPQQQQGLQVVPAVAWETEIKAVGGGTFRLSDYKDKVVVLDLWATWCGPCRAEIPHLVELNNEYGGKGVEIIGLTTEDPNSAAEAVDDFAKEMKINYKLGWARGDVAMALMNGRPSIPQTFVIAPGGKIVMRVVGFRSDIAEMIRTAVSRTSEKTGD